METSNLNLMFKASSDNQEKVGFSINDESWLLERATEGAFTNNVYIEIFGTVNDNRDFFEIGTLIGRYFKINAIINKYTSLFEVFDSIDQDTYMAYHALIDEEGNINMDYCGMKSNVFHIERFHIEEEYRNNGIGEKVLDYLDDILNFSLNCEVGCYILQPNPIIKNVKNQFEFIKDNNLNKKLKRKLLRFYTKCGYKKIPNTDFMYTNTDYVKTKRDFHLL